MELLNQAFARLAVLFRSLAPGARITAGLFCAVVVASLAYLATHRAPGGDTYLLNGQRLSSEELTAIEAAFGQAGLSTYEVEGNQIRVPRGEKAQYMAAAAEAGALPKDFGRRLTDAVTRSGPLTSRSQQEALLKIALQKELAEIIGSMRGIEKAAVLYDSQRNPGLQHGSTTTAMVSVKPLGNQPLAASQVPNIRHLVAAAIAGLSPDDVTVVDVNSRAYAGKLEKAGDEDPYLERMKHYQSVYEAKVRDALSYVPGVIVAANVELEREPTGFEALRPKRVAVSVAVPTSYFEKVWRERSPVAGAEARARPLKEDLAEIEAQETLKIRNLVAGLVPQNEALGDQRPLVAIATFSHRPQSEVPRRAMTQRVVAWLAGYGSSVGTAAVLVAIAGVVTFRAIVRTRAPARGPTGVAVNLAAEKASGADAPVREQRTRRCFELGPGAGPALRDELAATVRADPGAAANILRSWIGKAS